MRKLVHKKFLNPELALQFFITEIVLNLRKGLLFCLVIFVHCKHKRTGNQSVMCCVILMYNEYFACLDICSVVLIFKALCVQTQVGSEALSPFCFSVNVTGFLGSSP